MSSALMLIHLLRLRHQSCFLNIFIVRERSTISTGEDMGKHMGNRIHGHINSGCWVTHEGIEQCTYHGENYLLIFQFLNPYNFGVRSPP
jgi:hypothetical protein